MRDFSMAFTRAAKLMRNTAEVRLRPHGVHVGQNLVLDALSRTDGLTPKQLADMLGTSTPTIVKMTMRMERIGLIQRSRDVEDRRLVVLTLTRAGERACEAVDEAMAQLEEDALASLSRADRQKFVALLARMIENLDTTETESSLSNEPGL